MPDWILTGLLVIFWTALTCLAGCLLALIGWHVRAAVAGIREWLNERMPYEPPPSAYEPDYYEISDEDLVTAPDRDDEWAEELHRINGLGKMGDLTRPIAHQTHYEVEAVIRQLGHADWLPAAA